MKNQPSQMTFEFELEAMHKNFRLADQNESQKS